MFCGFPTSDLLFRFEEFLRVLREGREDVLAFYYRN